MHSHAGWGVDDPFNSDFTHSPTPTTAPSPARNYNSFTFANLSYDLTAKFLVGIEVSYWQTHYVDKTPGYSTHCDFVAKYSF